VLSNWVGFGSAGRTQDEQKGDRIRTRRGEEKREGTKKGTVDTGANGLVLFVHVMTQTTEPLSTKYFHLSGVPMSSMSLISRNGSFHGGRRSFDFPAPSLPTEIWHYIASLMPFSSFKESKLYAVNKDLLGYYLKRQYKHLRLGFSCDSCIYAERKSRLWSEKVAAIR
jgi:hypothetical protein